MKLFSLVGLAFVAALVVAVPVTAKNTPSGWRLSTDSAQAYVTYRRARVATRRAVRRDYRYTRRAYRHGYYGSGGYYGHADGVYGYPYSAGYYAYRGVYGAPVARGVARRAVVRRHW